MSAEGTASGGGGGGGGGERAPRLSGEAGAYAAWRPRIEGYLMRVSLLVACTTETAGFDDLVSDVAYWDVCDAEALLARAAANRAARTAGPTYASVTTASGSSSTPARTSAQNQAAKAPLVAAGGALSDEDKAMRRGVRELVARSQKAWGVLHEVIPDELRLQSAHITAGNAAALWRWLETKLQPTQRENVNELLSEFFSMAQEPGETFDAYRARVNKVDARLAAAKEPVSRTQYAFVLLDRLQPRYHAVVLALKVGDQLREADAIDWDAVTALINQSERSEDQLAAGSPSSGKAMAALQQSRGGGRGGGRGRSRGGRGGGQQRPNTRMEIQCFNCDEMGHFRDECPKPRKGSASSAPGGAPEGQRGGEYAAAARSVERLTQGDDADYEGDHYGFLLLAVESDDDDSDDEVRDSVPTPERAMAAGGSPAPAPLRRLVRPGEAAQGAPTAATGVRTAPAVKPAVTPAKAAAAREPAARKVGPEAKAAGRSDGRGPTASLSKALATTAWGIDTMASLNVTGNKEGFIPGSLRRCPGVQIQVADGAFVVATQRGKVYIRMRNAADTRDVGVTIDNVYFHERFQVNLLSWGVLKALGWRLRSDKDRSVVTTPGHNEIALRAAERVLVLEASATERVFSALVNGESAASRAGAQALLSMHERLGHVGFDRLLQLAKAGKTRGLEKVNRVSGVGLEAGRKLVLACKACHEGKETRRPFGHAGLDKGSAPFEVFHMDTFEVRQGDGTAAYYLVMAEPHSKARWVRRATSKDLIATQVLSTLERVHTQTGVQAKRLYSDGGSEFANRTLKAWCVSKGAELHLAPPRTQQLNGVAERGVRSIKDGARTLLRHCGLPADGYAGYALENFVHVWNRTAVSAVTGVTPYEAMYKRAPSVEHLHVFGCDAFVHVPKEQRGAFDAKADAGVYLGHDGEMNCAVVLRLRDGKLVRSRDVTADDGSFKHALAISAGRNAVAALVEQGEQPTLPLQLSRTESIVEESADESSAEEFKISGITGRRLAGGSGNVQYRVKWEGYSKPTWEPRDQLVKDGVQHMLDAYDAVQDAIAADAPSRRTRTAGLYEQAHIAMSALLQSDTPRADEPSTHAEALSGRFGPASRWQAGMDSEIDGCIERGVWIEVKVGELPAGANVLPCKWVYKVKTDEAGVVTAHKARLTPKGFRQVHGLDYNEVFAPTGRYGSMRVALSLAVRLDYEVEQLDVKQAFLNAELKEEVYMEMPPGYKKPDTVLRLRKALYGLKQAPREWQQLIDGFLRAQLGFTPTVSDPCLYTLQSQGGRLIILFLFVDDMQVSFHRADAAEWAALKAMLLARFETKDMGESTWMLAMHLKRDRVARTATLTQELYVSKAQERFGLTQCKTVDTPERVGHEEELGGDEPAHDAQRYMELVGTLMYATICTRPDAQHAIMVLARHMQAPLRRHELAAERVLRYLAGTKHMGLVFGAARSGDGGEGKGGHCSAPIAGGAALTGEVVAYADADWANDRSDRKSVTGWVVRLNGDVVAWASKKQHTVAQSTFESELYAEGAAINEVLWQRGLLAELGVRVQPCSTVYGDNQATVSQSANGVKSERTKHIDIKWHFITQQVQAGTIKIEWISTDKQQADIFTKALARPQFEVLRALLLGQ